MILHLSLKMIRALVAEEAGHIPEESAARRSSSVRLYRVAILELIRLGIVSRVFKTEAGSKLGSLTCLGASDDNSTADNSSGGSMSTVGLFVVDDSEASKDMAKSARAQSLSND